MLPVLRGHQSKNVEELRTEVSAGRDPLLVAPCGYGKGTLITYIIFSAIERALRSNYSISIIFAVHGNSLVVDMDQRVTALGITHGVLVGGKPRERWHPVQVASIDTLYRMDFPPRVDLMICDEAHMAVSPTWKKLIVRLRLLNPDMRILGTSATPTRLDGKGLGKANGGLFDSMVLGPSVMELIEQGYLVRSRVLEPPIPEGARELKKDRSGKIPDAAQAAVFDKVKLIGDEIEHYKKHASGRKGVTFGCTQAHASHLAQMFTEAGVPWAYVDAKTPLGDPKFPVPGTRAYIYRDLDRRDGTLLGVSSVGCTSTGWDHPIISYLGFMRVTESFSLHHQMMGRGSRIDPISQKSDFLIIDHAGNVQRHSPLGYFESPIEWSLDGEAVRLKDKKSSPIVTCKQSVMNCWCGDDSKHTGAGDHLACYGTWKPGPDACPYCGCPIVKKAREIETVAGELVEHVRPTLGNGNRQILLPGWTSVGTPTDRRAELNALLATARAKGYEPGWAGHIFEAKFKMKPPRDWMPREWQEKHPVADRFEEMLKL